MGCLSLTLEFNPRESALGVIFKISPTQVLPPFGVYVWFQIAWMASHPGLYGR